MNKPIVTILGTGTCVSSHFNANDFRNPPGYLIQIDQQTNMLLDCSEGIRARLEKIGFDYFSISHIFISHFHPDHFNLESLIQAIFVRALWSKTKKKITIFGPKNIEKTFRTIWNSKHYSNFYEETMEKVLDIAFVELADGKEIELSSVMRFEAHAVFHEQAKMDAFSLRFMINNIIYAYSGDTGICDGVIKAAHNADYFICESSANIGEDKSETAGHLNASQAAAIATKAQVKNLYLTHYTGKDSVAAMENAVKEFYNGKTVIAQDYVIIR